MQTEYDKIESFITKDKSVIRELMYPDSHGNTNQSLAEAIIPAGEETLLHKHIKSEELYHVLEGEGLMILGDRKIVLKPRNTVCIHPGVAHSVINTGKVPLIILCCCSPPYSHEDTELL